jgi:hypothetical protein
MTSKAPELTNPSWIARFESTSTTTSAFGKRIAIFVDSVSIQEIDWLIGNATKNVYFADAVFAACIDSSSLSVVIEHGHFGCNAMMTCNASLGRPKSAIASQGMGSM